MRDSDVGSCLVVISCVGNCVALVLSSNFVDSFCNDRDNCMTLDAERLRVAQRPVKARAVMCEVRGLGLWV